MKKIKTGFSLLKKAASSDGGEEYDEPEEMENRKKGRKKKGKGKKSKSSETTPSSSGTDGDTENQSESEEDDEEELREKDPAAAAHLRYAKEDKRFGSETFIDTDKPRTWHVLLRVIEGRDLKTGAMRVRAYLESLQKCTRVSSTGQWRQNLVFMLKDMSLQNLAQQNLDIKVTRAKRFSEKAKGEFCCPMAAIIHCPGKAVISKWVALSAPFDEEDDEGVHENCGFLKVVNSMQLLSLHKSHVIKIIASLSK